MLWWEGIQALSDGEIWEVTFPTPKAEGVAAITALVAPTAAPPAVVAPNAPATAPPVATEASTTPAPPTTTSATLAVFVRFLSFRSMFVSVVHSFLRLQIGMYFLITLYRAEQLLTRDRRQSRLRCRRIMFVFVIWVNSSGIRLVIICEFVASFSSIFLFQKFS
jgi:hypothetical protein